MNTTTAMLVATVAVLKGVPYDRYIAFISHTWADEEEIQTALRDAYVLLIAMVEEDHRD